MGGFRGSRLAWRLATLALGVALSVGSPPIGPAHANTLFNDLWEFDDDDLEFDSPTVRTVDNAVCAGLLPDDSANLVQSCSCVGDDLTVTFPVGSGTSADNPACRVPTSGSGGSSSPEAAKGEANTTTGSLMDTGYARMFTSGIPTTEQFLAQLLSEGFRDYYNALYGARSTQYSRAKPIARASFPSGFFVSHRESGRFAGRVSLRDVQHMRAARSHLLAQNNADGRQLTEQFGVPDPVFDTRFNAWVDGSYTFLDDDRAGNQRDGGSGRVALGASYRVSETVAVGAEALYRFVDSERDDRSSRSEADGFGGAVFATFVLPHRILITPLIAYEQVETDLTQVFGATALTGGFDTDIWTFGGQVTTRFDRIGEDGCALYWLRPAASASYVTADRGAFTRSDRVAIAGDTLDRGTLTFGAEAGAAFFRPDRTMVVLEPSIGVNGIWNFETIADQLVTGGAVVEDPDLFASVTGALSATFSGGATARFATTYSGLGSDVTAVTLSGQIVVPFGP